MINSYDIFDTLIARTVINPTDIFDIIGSRIGVPAFKNIRITAQNMVNMNDSNLINPFDEIYKNFKQLTILSDEQINLIKLYEIEVEKEHIIPVI